MGFELFLPFFKNISIEIFKKVAKAAKTNNLVFKVNDKNIENSLIHHMNKINTFSSQVSFKELSQPKDLSTVFIPLESFNSQKVSSRGNVIEIVEKIFLESQNNVVLTGAPGAGKSTTVKFICQRLFNDSKFLGQSITFPILIRFRDDEISKNDDIPIFEYILNVLGIIVDTPSKNDEESRESRNSLNLFKKTTVLTLLNAKSPLLIFDGLDEIGNNRIKEKVISNINEISLSAPASRFILTTRKGDDLFHFENTQRIELAPLSFSQIEEFSRKWLTESKPAEFLVELRKSSVFDAATRPLSLAHLCAIYENEGRLPEKSKSIYRKIVNMLILEWNIENKLYRTSIFSNFEADRKKDFLENLAFELTMSLFKNQFYEDDLRKCYRDLHIKFDLPFDNMWLVINEIQIHNGLILRTGSDMYEFAHKSFQEYLTAEYIVKLPKIPIDKDLLLFPAEMALAVTLSSEPTGYFVNFIDEYLLKKKYDLRFLKSFFTRLSIEKPDFRELLGLGVSVLRLQDKYCRSALLDDSIKLLNETFSIIFRFNNLRFSLSSVMEHFRIDQTINEDNFTVSIKFMASNEKEGESFIVTQDFYNTFLLA